MKLTTDEILEKIGSFGRYQIVLNIYFNIAYGLWWAFPVMVDGVHCIRTRMEVQK